MKKQLPIQTIANELTGASVFFQSPTPPSGEPAPLVQKETPSVKPVPPSAPSPASEPTTLPAMHPQTHASQTAAMNLTMPPEPQTTMTPRYHDTVTPSTIELVRKAVKQIGKEAATHRYTTEEKKAIAELVYSYTRRGYRTSENELSRIAINWLLLDHKTHGAESILEQVLRSLNE